MYTVHSEWGQRTLANMSPEVYTAVSHLPNTFAFHFQRLHLGEVVIVSDNVGDDGLFIRMVDADICVKTETHNVS